MEAPLKCCAIILEGGILGAKTGPLETIMLIQTENLKEIIMGGLL